MERVPGHSDRLDKIVKDDLPHLLDIIKQREAQLALTVTGGIHVDQLRHQAALLTEVHGLYFRAIALNGEAINLVATTPTPPDRSPTTNSPPERPTGP